MPVSIRPLRAADYADWHRLWTAYLAFYATTRPESVFATTFARLIDPAHPRHNALVAEAGGALVGLVHYIYHPHNWQAADVCYLQDLYVDPSTRGTGTGRALIEGVYAAADTHGAPSVYWVTDHGNTTARQLYDRVAKLTPFIKYLR